MPSWTETETLAIRWGDAVVVGASGKDPQKDARTDEQERIDHCLDTQPDAAIPTFGVAYLYTFRCPLRPAAGRRNRSRQTLPPYLQRLWRR
jgi:hypothetical protein